MLLVIHWNNDDWYAFGNIPFSIKASTKTLIMLYGHVLRHVQLKEMPKLQAGTDILEVYAESDTWAEEEVEE